MLECTRKMQHHLSMLVFAAKDRSTACMCTQTQDALKSLADSPQFVNNWLHQQRHSL